MQVDTNPGDTIPAALPASGSCLCGAVHFTTPALALWCAHCHCTRCQRAHGAAFVTWVGTRAADTDITDPSRSLRWFEADEPGADGERGFCGFCGSPMFFRSGRWPGELHIARALFSTPVEPAPQLHAYYDTHAPWVVLGDRLPGRAVLKPRAARSA